MKEIQTKAFVAFDGKPFLTEKECADYEAANYRMLLVGLTQEQVDAALSRTDLDRANALEIAAKHVARIRLGGRLRAPAQRKTRGTTPDNADALARAAASKLEPVEPPGAGPISWAPQDIQSSLGSLISTNPEDRHDPSGEQDMGGPAAGAAA